MKKLVLMFTLMLGLSVVSCGGSTEVQETIDLCAGDTCTCDTCITDTVQDVLPTRSPFIR